MLDPRDFPPLIPRERSRVRGRTAAKNVDRERRKHLRALAMRRFHNTPIPTLAAMRFIAGGRKITERTIHRWLRYAADYPEAGDDEMLAEYLPSVEDVIKRGTHGHARRSA